MDASAIGPRMRRRSIETLTEGPQILVGSSMGGWISLLMSQRIPARVAGLVTIAAAPDFTEDGFWAEFQRGYSQMPTARGVVNIPSDYGDPYPITKRLIEDGRTHLLLRTPLEFAFPIRLLQGDEDEDVSVQLANRLFAHIKGPRRPAALAQRCRSPLFSAKCIGLDRGCHC